MTTQRTSSVSAMIQDLGWEQLRSHRQQVKAVIFYRIINRLVNIQAAPILIPARTHTRRDAGQQISCSSLQRQRLQVSSLPVQHPARLWKSHHSFRKSDHVFNRTQWTFRHTLIAYAVELQMLEHIWGHVNMFETGVVEANEF